jgi:predicted naringenin-chalcone synthase
MIANALFADGAGAAVIGAPRGRAPLWEVAASGSRLFPGSAEAMTWRIGDHGFEMTLSPQVPGLLRAELRPWIESWLDNRATDRRSGRSVPSQHGPPELTLADIRAFAIHPGGPKILDAAAAALALSDQALTASREILNRHGNMSSPTILFILDRLRREAVRGSASTPAPLLALAFGPGLTAEAALLLSAL